MDLKSEPPGVQGWKKPLPERLPRPTYWPALLALGVTVALLGPVTLLPVGLVGLAIAVAALIGWIGEIMHA